MNRRVTLAAVFGSSLLLLVWSANTGAQNAPEPAPAPTPEPAKPADDAPPKPVVITVVDYPVRDLLLSLRDYPLNGSLMPVSKIREPANADQQGQPQTQQSIFGNTQPAAQPAMEASQCDELIKRIYDLVDTTSWKDRGGEVGSISYFDGQLTVTQTPENQAAIARVISEIRKKRNVMVRLRADWVLLSRAELDKLLKNGPGDTAALPEIDRTQLASLANGTGHCASQIVSYSGQTVHLTSGRVKSVVTDVSPVVAPDAVAMSPTVVIVNFGIALEVNTTVFADAATLDLSSEISQTNDKSTPPATRPSMPELDRLNNLVQNFRTTVQVPLNKPVLIAGATADPSDATPGKELYLIVEADTGK